MTNDYSEIVEPIVEAMDEKYLKAEDINNLSNYDDTDLKSKIGYNSIPSGSNLQSQINAKADTSDFDTLEVTITYTNNTTETVELYIVPTAGG